VEERPSDADLVRAAQAGDAASLGLLLERHRAGMQAVALRLLGYRPEAQDAVQDAMLVALRRLGELRDPASAGPWLRAIVRNACRMRLRAPRTDLVDDRVLLALPADEPSPQDLLDRHALRHWVWQALEELSEPLRLVVLLRYFGGVSGYDQIAALCDVPVGTVRSRLNQARRKLGAALLATAGVAHDDAAALAARRWREVAQWLAAAERGEFGAALAESWSADLALVGPQGQRGRGLDMLVRIMDSDLEAGVRQRPVAVTASRRFTIIEAELLNPPSDPGHCPPGVVWLLSLRAGRVEHARLFHPRPGGPATA
jgi:RNA polymerase sigma-70 factor (ECF subfamily)